MCTMLILNRLRPDFPVVVAANRDEMYERPTTPAAVLRDAPRILAGRDERSGGTWMGVTANGLFVGVTNQRTYEPGERAPRSRGEVVLDALRAGSVPAVDAYLAGLDPGAFRSFNLLYGDATVLKVAYARRRERSLEIETVPPGLHVLPNDPLDSPAFPKVARLIEAVRPTVRATAEPWPTFVATLEGLLADHEKPSIAEVEEPPAGTGSMMTRALLRELHAVCIHTPAYGTRSSTIAALGPGAVGHYLFADGPPCRTKYQDLAHELPA